MKYLTPITVLLTCLLLTAGSPLALADNSAGKHHHTGQSSPVGEMMMRKAESKIGSLIPGDIQIINQNGEHIPLSSLMDKPLFVSFVYTRCPNVCPTITANLSAAIEKSRELYGDTFRAVTISFDVDHDTPAIMKKYGEKFTLDSKLWTFAVAEKKSVAKLTDAFGFVYIPDPQDTFNHTSMVSIVHKGGALIHQVYGTDFTEDQFVKVLKVLLDDIKEQNKVN